MDIARYHVIHETRYDYESPVSLSRQLLHLTPRACPWQRSIAHEIVIAPTPGVDRVRVDSFGNPVRQFAIEAPHGSLLVRAESRIEVRSRRLDATAFAAPEWESVRDRLAYGVLPVELEASIYLFESPYTRVKREFAAYAAPSFTPGRPLLDAVRDLMQRVFRDFRYDAGATTVATPVLTVLEQRRGVCQDFAHLMISCLRSLGLSARYVSGYLLTRPPPGKPRLVGADASHAWLSVFCPDVSGGIWVDFDPTNNVLPDREHITVAWGRDFGDVSPLRGVILGGDAHQPEVAVTVLPYEEE
ncbi:transglutaminase family protein [Propionivibrio dicarboxylicus]|uniref:Transglutaminase-like enzyme, putative cysteine protease n=1 Tax=Propionivibrio dicarboxylicus TaxID=83767 RepID=A0A1G8A702_9RHOO|nr:transglutaminase family protein [Propionivibrio dicarboxylicus]SDH16724.1 Transglutaminase-like enzyme, putative cysteine protease [Propionivibrio dicarboxylicus]